MNLSHRQNVGGGLFAAIMALLVAWSSSAIATPDYPSGIATYLGVSCVPQCTICHATNAGGTGTITQPFGKSMQAHGLRALSDTSLYSALDAMEADGTDSICDGTPDIEDLKACRDPNVPDTDAGANPAACGAGPSFDSPRYGCGAHIAPTPSLPAVPVAAPLVFLCALALARWRTK